MRVYLAGTYSRMRELEKLSLDLPGSGMVSSARWLKGGEEGLSYEDIAILDMDDIDSSEAIVAFTSERYAPVGGGHLWELGYAYANGKRCFVIGPESTVFVRAPGIVTLDSWEDFLSLEWAT